MYVPSADSTENLKGIWTQHDWKKNIFFITPSRLFQGIPNTVLFYEKSNDWSFLKDHKSIRKDSD